MSLFQICFLVLNLSCFICIAFIQGLQAHDKKEKQKTTEIYELRNRNNF